MFEQSKDINPERNPVMTGNFFFFWEREIDCPSVQIVSILSRTVLTMDLQSLDRNLKHIAAFTFLGENPWSFALCKVGLEKLFSVCFAVSQSLLMNPSAPAQILQKSYSGDTEEHCALKVWVFLLSEKNKAI